VGLAEAAIPATEQLVVAILAAVLLVVAIRCAAAQAVYLEWEC